MRPLKETEAAWVSDYFGDDYLRIYEFPCERTDPEVTFLVNELTKRIPLDGLVLDVGCGQGRHAIPLARQGFRVTGLDYQDNLLDAARESAAHCGATVEWVQGDMRSLPFTESFDAVINLFTAFGYFSDAENARVVAEMARVLRPGGWLVLDVANRDALLRHTPPRHWKRLPDGAMLVSEWEWDALTARYTHRQWLMDGRQPREYAHTVRVYTYQELSALLAQAGMTVEQVYGAFTGEPLTLDAPRMILLARKDS